MLRLLQYIGDSTYAQQQNSVVSARLSDVMYGAVRE